MWDDLPVEPWKVEEVYKDGVLVERRMKRGPDCEWEPLLTPPRRETRLAAAAIRARGING